MSAGRVIVRADGGSRGNPGTAGAGTLVSDAASGAVLRRIAWVFGAKATNNVAEYRGLINGLKAARDLGARSVEVRMDSKLVVEQMSGRWKIKHPDMKKLALQAREIAKDFEAVSYRWVPRKDNSEADALANKAMDAAKAGHPEGELDPGGEQDAGGQDAGEQNAEPQGPAVPGSARARALAAAAAASESGGSRADHNGPQRWRDDDGPVTRLILLRHGQTSYSRQGQYSGRADPELTALGRRQAAAAAQLVRARGGIDRIVSSPLRRARQTAAFAADALELDVTVDDGLIEVDFGDWEGATFDQVRAAAPEAHRKWLADPELAPPNGESLAALHRRVTAWREDFCAAHPGETVLAVSHVNPVKSVIAQGLGCGADVFGRMFLDLAGLSVVEFSESGGTVRAVNLTGGLADA